MSEKDMKKANKQIEDLQKQIDELTAEKQDLFEKLQRISADYANYQKRVPKQIADSVAYEKKAVIRSLLPSIDNFDHALAHASEAHSGEALDNIIKGIRLVFDHMLDALKSHGVQRMEALGQPFDPNLHEAMMRRTEPDKPDNTVLEVYQAGYMMNDQVLRPGKVIVNKLEDQIQSPAPAEQPATQDVDETTDIEPEV